MRATAAPLVLVALALACGPPLDPRRPLDFRASPGVPAAALRVLSEATLWLPVATGAPQPVVVELSRAEPYDAWVSSLDRGRIYLHEDAAAELDERRLRVLLAHELGHCFGAEHLPACEGRNVMAMGCVPDQDGYSPDDLREIFDE